MEELQQAMVGGGGRCAWSGGHYLRSFVYPLVRHRQPHPLSRSL
jgi:hypothetical protein